MSKKPKEGRAKQVAKAWEAHTKDHGADSYVSRTSRGTVSLERLTEHSDDSGTEWVEVYAAGQTEGADPHFRIFTPPTLVEDPAGDIERGGKTYRVDPLAALAEVVAQHGGAQVARTKRRTRG